MSLILLRRIEGPLVQQGRPVAKIAIDPAAITCSRRSCLAIVGARSEERSKEIVAEVSSVLFKCLRDRTLSEKVEKRLLRIESGRDEAAGGQSVAILELNPDDTTALLDELRDLYVVENFPSVCFYVRN